MRKHVINLLIHKDRESGKLVYKNECLESINESIKLFDYKLFGVAIFLNGGLWNDEFKKEIEKFIPSKFIEYFDSDEMLNIGKVRNKMSHEYFISEYFTMMDGDDEIPDYFHAKLEKLVEMRAPLIRWKVKWVNIDKSTDIPHCDHMKKHLSMYDYLPNFSYLIRRKDYVESGLQYPENMIVREDSMWSMMLNMRYNQIYFYPEVMYIYRNDYSQMSTNQRKNLTQTFEQVGYCIDYTLKNLYDEDMLPRFEIIKPI